MYLCPILNAGKVNLTAATRILGKGPRQVRRYVETGQLRASGGGHGVPYEFAKRDLSAFMQRMKGKTYQRRQTWRGLVDGDTLARIAHAAALRQDNPGKYLYYVNAGFVALWSLSQTTVKGLLRGCLPPLDSVPDETRRWAARLASGLSPVELDYVAAMFIVRLNPATRFEGAEAGALGVAMDVVKRTRPYLFYNEKTFQQSPEAWAAVADSVLEKYRELAPARIALDMAAHKREVFFGPDLSRAWEIYAAHHPLQSAPGRLIEAAHRGDVPLLLRLVKGSADGKRPPAYPEAYAVLRSLIGATKKLGRMRERSDRTPSGNRVGQVLGLKYRAQGTRILKRIFEKVPFADAQELIYIRLRCDKPRVWKLNEPQRPKAQRVIVFRCDICGAVVNENMDECPECKHLLGVGCWKDKPLPGQPKQTTQKYRSEAG